VAAGCELVGIYSLSALKVIRPLDHEVVVVVVERDRPAIEKPSMTEEPVRHGDLINEKGDLRFPRVTLELRDLKNDVVKLGNPRSPQDMDRGTRSIPASNFDPESFCRSGRENADGRTRVDQSWCAEGRKVG